MLLSNETDTWFTSNNIKKICLFRQQDGKPETDDFITIAKNDGAVNFPTKSEKRRRKETAAFFRLGFWKETLYHGGSMQRKVFPILREGDGSTLPIRVTLEVRSI
ncbi:MAG: hypothetical protein IJB22_08665 [Clostridia bacterium]|nr:hypothetical protein [Clostridia bacterium]